MGTIKRTNLLAAESSGEKCYQTAPNQTSAKTPQQEASLVARLSSRRQSQAFARSVSHGHGRVLGRRGSQCRESGSPSVLPQMRTAHALGAPSASAQWPTRAADGSGLSSFNLSGRMNRACRKFSRARAGHGFVSRRLHRRHSCQSTPWDGRLFPLWEQSRRDGEDPHLLRTCHDTVRNSPTLPISLAFRLLPLSRRDPQQYTLYC